MMQKLSQRLLQTYELAGHTETGKTYMLILHCNSRSLIV